ncbi:magnesium transporter [Leptotrichia trevisanii]|uniref:Magnesium transporter MgtE n=1 Tax=Leptotrichia trevisanii TaxID=109328 RepID=A0A510L5K7_9FUSO|nr:magnesium transporter [Leptotrichia trevisanii]BBM45776.1 magnesium transporter [Leptotrichia trevisanii]BBM52987.1 magnesium transporter [Leptotrichia trevisanii]BBM57783.1 magnesium transporter [Leptotrichia trevisanii]
MKELIETLLKEKKYFEIKSELNELNAVEISDVLNQFKLPELVIMIFRLLKKDKAADVFPYLDSEHQEMIIHASTDIETREIFDELYFDDIVDIIEEMPSNIVKKILKNTDKKDRHLINQLLKYPDNSAGSIMTTEYVDLQKNMKVSEAIEEIRKTGKDKENIYTCYVTEKNGKLEGVLSLKELIAKKDSTEIEDIMNKNFVSVNTNDDQEIVADLFKKYDFIVMPVVDHENRILGIITVDDVMDVVDQEVTEDFHKMAGITSPTDDSYLKTNVFTMAKQRIGWLAVLMISDTISGNIIQGYEKVLAKSIILTAFIPMLMSSGGNVGSQSSTVVIRSLALGEISPKDAFKVIKKEFFIGTMVSIVLSVLNFIRLITLEKTDPTIALIVSLTLVFTIIISKLVGALLPLGAKIVKADPAVMATPLITTISDAVTLVIYFTFATTLLNSLK